MVPKKGTHGRHIILDDSKKTCRLAANKKHRVFRMQGLALKAPPNTYVSKLRLFWAENQPGVLAYPSSISGNQQVTLGCWDILWHFFVYDSVNFREGAPSIVRKHKFGDICVIVERAKPGDWLFFNLFKVPIIKSSVPSSLGQ